MKTCSISFFWAMVFLPVVTFSAGIQQIPVTREKLAIHAEKSARRVYVDVSTPTESVDKSISFDVRDAEEAALRFSVLPFSLSLYDVTDTVWMDGLITDEKGHTLFSGSGSSEIGNDNGRYYLKNWKIDLELNSDIPIYIDDFDYAHIKYVDEKGREREMFVFDNWDDDAFLFPVDQAADRVTMVIIHTFDEDGEHKMAFSSEGQLIEPKEIRVLAGFGFKELGFLTLGENQSELTLNVPSRLGVGRNKVFKVTVENASSVITVKGQTSEGKLPVSLVIDDGVTTNPPQYPMVNGKTTTQLVFDGPAVYYLYFVWKEGDLSPPDPEEDGYGKGSLDK